MENERKIVDISLCYAEKEMALLMKDVVETVEVFLACLLSSIKDKYFSPKVDLT